MHDEIINTIKQFIEAMPYSKELNLHLEELRAGYAVMAMPYASKLVGDPNSGVLHGGAVSALLDTCCGAAVMTHPDNAGITATLDLRIDYLRPATRGDAIKAEAECHKVTNSVAFVRATAFDHEIDRPIATAVGAFTVTKKNA